MLFAVTILKFLITYKWGVPHFIWQWTSQIMQLEISRFLLLNKHVGGGRGAGRTSSDRTSQAGLRRASPITHPPHAAVAALQGAAERSVSSQRSEGAGKIVSFLFSSPASKTHAPHTPRLRSTRLVTGWKRWETAKMLTVYGSLKLCYPQA